MPGSPLLSGASDLFKSAGQVEEGISERAFKAQEGAAERRNHMATETLSTAIQADSANKRTAMTEQGANERQQAEINSQFLTLTPQLKKGAADLTGDKSWADIPDNYRMRADVYSALIGAGSKMTEMMKPRTLEIQEGDQVYTAEYDPKTKELRKLAGPGNKFSPNERDKKDKSGTDKLNPFTLQNIVRQDEKTMLEQLGNKGAKGIPHQSELGALMSKVSGGRLGELSDKENAKLATLKSLASRLKNNYENLQRVEEARGLSPTQVDPGVLDTINKLVAPAEPKSQGASGTKVLMKSPDGKSGYVPTEKVQEALKRGFTKL